MEARQLKVNKYFSLRTAESPSRNSPVRTTIANWALYFLRSKGALDKYEVQ